MQTSVRELWCRLQWVIVGRELDDNDEYKLVQRWWDWFNRNAERYGFISVDERESEKGLPGING